MSIKFNYRFSIIYRSVQFELRSQNANAIDAKNFKISGTISVDTNLSEACQHFIVFSKILVTLNFFTSMTLYFGFGAQIGQA